VTIPFIDGIWFTTACVVAWSPGACRLTILASE
jgi:hypothetical protein